jgi:hypothetical protein
MSSVVISGNTSGTVTLSAPDVAGTTVLSLPNGSGTVVTSTNISNYTTPARGGASYATLSSGTPNITLTSASNQVQVITADAAGQSITLPNMTTLTAGAGYFVFYNTSIYAVALKDAGGTIREYLLPAQATGTSPIQGITLIIEDISTSNGVWHCQNPTAAIANNSFNYTATTITQASSTILVQYMSYIGGNYFLFVAYNNTNLRICLGTLNTSTKTFTFGSYTTLFTAGSNEQLSVFGVDSNGSDRGLLVLGSTKNIVSTPSAWSAYGFAVVSGTLYVSSASTFTGVTTGGSGGSADYTNVQYAGSNNAFLSTAAYSSSTTFALRVGGYTVSVASTTVTLAAATGTYTTSNTSSDYYSVTFTSPTTMAMDRQASTASPAYLSYNTSTNAITSGARTSQTSRIAGVLLPDVLDYSVQNYTSNSSSKWIFSTSGNKVISLNLAAVVANVGSATLTVSTTTFTLKSFSSKSYITLTGSIYIKYVYIASASVGYAYDSTNYLWYSFDPSNSNLNFNYGSASLAGATNYAFISSTQIAPLGLNYPASGIISTDIQTFATPFIS